MTRGAAWASVAEVLALRRGTRPIPFCRHQGPRLSPAHHPANEPANDKAHRERRRRRLDGVPLDSLCCVLDDFFRDIAAVFYGTSTPSSIASAIADVARESLWIDSAT
jgi:hypothetical protein